MAVTLYRCSKCRGLFNTVFEPLKMCRDCKLNQTSGGTSQASLRTLAGVSDSEELTIIEPEGDSMGGGKAGQAIGGPIGQAENPFAATGGSLGMFGGGQQNVTNDLQYLQAQAGQQQAFSGGSEIRSPFIWTEANTVPIAGALQVGQTFVSTDGVMRVITAVQRLDDTRVMVTDTMGVIAVVEVPQQPSRISMEARLPPKPEPESSPHDAILKPSRKLKFAAE